MGSGVFNVHHAVQSITHTASNVGHKALELANPIPKPAEGRSRGDQARTILRKAGSTVTHVGRPFRARTKCNDKSEFRFRLRGLLGS